MCTENPQNSMAYGHLLSLQYLRQNPAVHKPVPLKGPGDIIAVSHSYLVAKVESRKHLCLLYLSILRPEAVLPVTAVKTSSNTKTVQTQSRGIDLQCIHERRLFYTRRVSGKMTWSHSAR